MRKMVIGLVAAGCLLAVGVGLFLRFRDRMGIPTRPPLGGASAVGGGEAVKDAGDNWPGFRGPDGTGVSTDAKVPLEWSETKNLRWKVPLPGPGSSSPVVWGGRVFVTCYSGYGDGSGDVIGDLKRHLLCINRADGKVLWTKSVPAVQPEDPYRGYLTEHGYASSTPVTDGERVYVFFGKTGVLAYDLEGLFLWQANVGTGSSNRRWGSASSLVLYKDTVIVNASEESRAVVALDRKTGKEVWKAPGRTLELCFGTPLLLGRGEGRHDLVLAVPSELWGLNPDTGKLTWYAKIPPDGNVSPSVAARGDVVFATGGYPSTQTVAVRAGGTGDVTESNVLWTAGDASYVPSPVAHGGHLYLVNDQGTAVCLDADTGEQVARARLAGVTSGSGAARPVYASPVLVNGKLYAVTRRAGTFVVEASPKLAQVARNRFADDGSDFNASPAVSKGQLFIRSNRYLYCVEAEKP